MSRPRGILILATAEGWRIIRRRGGAVHIEDLAGAQASPEETAEALARAIGLAGRRAPGVVVGVAGELCLSGTIPTAGLPRRGAREAMTYRLEERLPFAAESLSADFLAHNGAALGVCVQRQVLWPVIDALRQRGIKPVAVCPAALLAYQAAAEQITPQRLRELHAVLLQGGDEVDLFILADGEPVGWQTFCARAADLSLAIASQVLKQLTTMNVIAVGAEAELLQAIDASGDATVIENRDWRCEDLALAAAESIACGRAAPPVNLLRGGGGSGDTQSSRGARIFAIAAILFALSAAGACMVRAQRYSRRARMADAEKRQVFSSLFPGERVPTGIESRLRSVRRQLHAPAAAAPGAPDAMPALHELLTHLPADLRYRIGQIDVESGRLTLEGDVRSHEDADRLAAALRRSTVLRVEDPQTQQIRDAVRFTISASAPRETNGGGR